MRADPSALAALGLEPGADAAAVERAYKTLIKRYHPDRPGGDPKRAAEINRAYRDLVSPGRQYGDIALHRHPVAKRELSWSGAAWLVALASVIGLSIGLLASQKPFGAVTAPIAAAVDDATREDPPKRLNVDIMDRPLNLSAIDSAVLEAATIASAQDEVALSAASRTCHERMQQDPALSQFDRCTAFDDAVVKLQDRDPFRDKGNFSQLAVTGRQWSAAAMISRDQLATDSRMKQIRLRVELMLTSSPPESEEN